MRYHPYTQCELDTQAKEYCAGLRNRVNEHRRNWPKEYIVSMKDCSDDGHHPPAVYHQGSA